MLLLNVFLKMRRVKGTVGPQYKVLLKNLKNHIVINYVFKFSFGFSFLDLYPRKWHYQILKSQTILRHNCANLKFTYKDIVDSTSSIPVLKCREYFLSNFMAFFICEWAKRTYL